MSTASIYKLSKEKALERIIQFTQRFGQAHFELACHAAFPALLTPDLLSRIWANFLMYTPWTAISDILLSPLCQEVGYELYEMHSSLKEILLEELCEEYDYGNQRLNELDHFLKEYISLYLSSNNPDDHDIALAQHWTALAHTQPDNAAREIALALQNLAELGGIEMIRISSLVDSLSQPLNNYKPLLSYARGIFHLSRQEIDTAVNNFRTIFDESNNLQIAGVQLTIPDAVKSHMGKTAESQGAISPPDDQRWRLPRIEDILDKGSAPETNEEFIQQRARLIEDTLASFSAPAQVVEISRGPTITQFGVEPLYVETRSGRTRVRVNKIAALADDLALALSAPRIRIQAPVPGRGFVGIEVPNDEMTLVALHDILESETFQRKRAPLSFALGRDVAGIPQIATLDTMPHLLIAGTTGSGKSVCVNSILTSFLLHNTPDELKLVLVDPKRVELTGYNGIPHLLAPVIVEVDRVVGALQWMTREMDKRYHLFAQVGARNIADYNGRMKVQGGKKLPFLVIVIDELADLMMIAPDETERTITRLAQLARATGIHMILATQRPSVDVITGLIKANFPARIAFAAASNTDSRVILDQPGAERLLGRGDMLYQAPDAPAPVRLQGVFVSDPEIQRLVDFWRVQVRGSAYTTGSDSMEAPLPTSVPLKQQAVWEEMQKEEESDPLYTKALDLIRREGRCSVSMLQRHLRIGYTRAARLVDMLEERGIVSEPLDGADVRDVLNYDNRLDDIYKEAVDIVREQRLVSPSSLQRRLNIDYDQVIQIITRMEIDGIVARPESGETIRRLIDFNNIVQSQVEEPPAFPPPPQVEEPTASLPPRDERLPSFDLLLPEHRSRPDERTINQTAGMIEKILSEFGISATVIGFRVGPTVTQFAVQPGFTKKTGSDEDDARQIKVRVAQIAALQKDLALALSAERLRIQAPVPGKPYVGIEIPNLRSAMVRLRPILETEDFYKIGAPLAIALGRDVSGHPVVTDLARMPHLLIAGATGSGKSVCITSIATCLAMNNPPDELRLVMIDSKMVELLRFNGLPHLYGKVETSIDRIMGVLRWVVVEMEHRYSLLEGAKARDLDSYNRKLARRNDSAPLPRIVVIIDELADLMMSAPDQTEHNLVRLAQMARATGIHLVVATQRPSTDVVTGLIKANFPARLAFAVASGIDSRVILDATGAETLLGRGDMLFLNPEVGNPIRAQGVSVSDSEIEKIISHWQKVSDLPVEDVPPWEKLLQEPTEGGDDALVEEAISIVQSTQRASASLLQRRLRIGYPRAARLLDQLEEMGIVGPSQGGGRVRDVLIEADDEDDYD